MPRQVVTAPLARLFERRAEPKLIWGEAAEIVQDPQFAPVFLFSVIGLLVTFCLAILFQIPAADSLLSMPG